MRGIYEQLIARSDDRVNKILNGWADGLREFRPVCRRCGVQIEEMWLTLHRDEATVRLKMYCHGVRAELPITPAGLDMLYDLIPKRVFEYEAASFGSWDANGSPV